MCIRDSASHEHSAQPGMVYISNPTEDGTLYTKEELTDLSATCYDLSLIHIYQRAEPR